MLKEGSLHSPDNPGEDPSPEPRRDPPTSGGPSEAMPTPASQKTTLDAAISPERPTAQLNPLDLDTGTGLFPEAPNPPRNDILIGTVPTPGLKPSPSNPAVPVPSNQSTPPAHTECHLVAETADARSLVPVERQLPSPGPRRQRGRPRHRRADPVDVRNGASRPSSRLNWGARPVRIRPDC